MIYFKDHIKPNTEVTGAHSITSLSMTDTSHRKLDLLGQPMTAVVFKDTIK